MGVHSMGAPLKSQICPLFSLRLQTANDYLALGGSVIRQLAHEIRQPQDKQVWHTHLPTTLLHRICTLWSNLPEFMFGFWAATPARLPVLTRRWQYIMWYNVKPASGFRLRLTARAARVQHSDVKHVESLIVQSVGCFHLQGPAVTRSPLCAGLCNVLCKVTLKGCLRASLPLIASSPLETQVPTHISHNHSK